ncbi:hypothetical protein [Granulicella paludicola]|uniref:hypothetical protein n=1 Tax=Granulicella paludicola TaxID=474951 RepID=UPI0021E06D16|nr:hypothetical protein [Granulicella paludicola]
MSESIGYAAYLEMELNSSLVSWSQGKWLSVLVVVVLVGLTALMGTMYLLISLMAVFIGLITQSGSVKKAVVDEVGTLAYIIKRWYISDRDGCKSFCLAPTKELVFGNMFHVVDRLEE